MRIEWAAVLALLLAWGAPVQAQDALSGVGERTQVGSIEFRFEEGHTLAEEELRRRIALTERGGLIGIRRIFGFLPFVGPIGDHPFDPLELQRDVVRLRNHFWRAGFLDVKVAYDVRYDAESDLVAVAFVIREGPPLLLSSVTFLGSDSGPPRLPAELERDWAGFVGEETGQSGRFGEQERLALADRTTRWLRNRGYPFGAAEAGVLVDTAANRAGVTVRVRPGLRARIREILVTGNETVPAGHFTRQLPIGVGDWYSAADLERGRAQLVQLDIVRLALLSVPRESADDSSIVVQLRVTENPPRLLTSEAGFTSDGGLSARTQWVNRSFLGGVRTLTVAAAAQTGALALESPAQRRYRLAVTLFQPYAGDRRLSAAGGPFIEYRDDVRDRSWAVGLEGALVYATGPLKSVSLGYNLSRRRIFDYGFGDELDPIEYLPLLGLGSEGGDTLATAIRRSTLTLDASYGQLDEFANPRRGYVLRPRISVTTPGALNSSEYLLLDLGATAFLPLNDRIGFTLRAGAGRILPFGSSVAAVESESPFVSLLRLRDVTFTAGGTRDVRGWGSQLLGPKLPEVRVESDGTAGLTFAERYAPVGGLARLVGSVELQLPLPGFSDAWQTFLFVDGGRVWTPDRRFALNAGELDQDDFYSAAGAGLGYETVVGALTFAVGYKLNPSALDLRRPEDVLQALTEGRPLSSVPTDNGRRLHLHFAIGATF
ncbi:MAG: BamA/TamA family outer membrane protein [Gemmatimonadales bacterium]|nr:BamA/TamA family outer membrane protein [Gemmatimonadales bacterium]